MTSDHRHELGYRAYIEGLRAVAILAVIAAHGRLGPFAGGFAGVDVFFVLSGYLITGLLLREIDRTGSVSLPAFYARRLRRLLPGLLLMLVCTSLLGWQLVPVSEQPEQGAAAASAALWVSNFFYAFDNIDYFAAGSETNLFLHTWSLGVEEQFYLVWPLLIAAGVGAMGGQKSPPRVQRLGAIMPVVLMLGLAACAAWTITDPTVAFYMMPARAWQFALGALVFIHGDMRAAGRSAKIDSRRVNAAKVAGWIGLATIVGSVTLLRSDLEYPWPWAVFPSLGAAGVLYAGALAPGNGAALLLSWRPLQAIGRISYSWYLWHWPVLLIGANLIDVRGLVPRVALVSISLLAALAAYRFVELPIRRMKTIVRFPRTAFATALAAAALVAGVGSLWHDRSLDRMHSPELMRFTKLLFDSPIVYGMGCDDWYRSASIKPCSFGPQDAPHVAVVIGDSVMMQWFPAVERIFHGPEWRLIALTKSACPMVDEPIVYAHLRREYTECAQWRDAALAEAARLHPEILLIGSTSAYDYTPAQWTEGTRRVLARISGHAGRVYLLRSTPRLPFNALACLAPRGILYRVLAANPDCIATASTGRSDEVFEWLTKAADGFANVTLIDLTPIVCPGNVCRAERDGVVVFRDSQHLTARFVASLTPALAERLGRPLPIIAPETGKLQHATAVPQSLP